MMNKECGLVQGIGVTPLPPNPQYFTEFSIPETVKIPEAKPDAEDLISVTVEAQVVSTRVITTAIGTSIEGQVLSGYKVIVELKLRQKIKYVAAEPTQTIHAAHFEKVVASVFVVIPPPANVNNIVVTPYIEDIYAVLKDKRTIFKNITVLVDVTGV